MKGRESLINCLVWTGSAFAGLVLLYFLTAPPVMMAAWKQSGSIHVAPAYRPVMRIIESDFGAPLLWYFNSVWHAGIILLGDDSPSWYMLLFYTVLGTALILAVLFPVIRTVIKRRHRA